MQLYKRFMCSQYPNLKWKKLTISMCSKYCAISSFLFHTCAPAFIVMVNKNVHNYKWSAYKFQTTEHTQVTETEARKHYGCRHVQQIPVERASISVYSTSGSIRSGTFQVTTISWSLSGNKGSTTTIQQCHRQWGCCWHNNKGTTWFALTSSRPDHTCSVALNHH